MAQYIDKGDLLAKIERRKQDAINNCGGFKSMREHECDNCIVEQYEEMENIVNTLEVREIEFPNPRFPHLDNIIEKVFGMGNLESWEYEEAKQLVLLAKEELLKDLEVKEVDLEEEITDYINRHYHIRFDETLERGNDPLTTMDFDEIAKHFFELGLKAAKKGE